MKHLKILAAVASAAMATAVAVAAPANAVNPTNLVDSEFGFAPIAEAYNLSASGDVLTIAPTTDASCDYSSSGPNHLATLNAGIATVKGLNSVCNVGEGGTYAAQSIASVNLFGGKIRLTALKSTCSDIDGVATVGSVVAKLNGVPLSKGTGKVVTIPGLASVIINDNRESDGTISSSAVRIDLLPVYVNGHQITPGQEIVVGQCSLTEEAD